ncbi:MAG TPA: histidine phosphatase family protein [Rhizomicrobium sp.]|nr:histidine phosphatase family protein [Rhizomicrobium sp.]
MSGWRDYTLFAVRHGETEDNVSQTITAQADSPLTALGRSQAKAKGPILRELADLSTLTFIASPLHRACMTMEMMREAAGLPALPYATDHRLQEMDFGDWTKKPEGTDRFTGDGPSAHELWTLVCPRGESQEMVYDRVGSFLESLKGDSVIVCHARVVSMIRAHALGLSQADTMRYEPSNAGVLRLVHGTEALFKE